MICINAYALRDVASLAWPVRRYTVHRRDGVELAHEERGALKGAVFALRRRHAARCPGWGFVVDIDARTIVLPALWEIPSNSEAEGLTFELELEFVARADDPRHDAIVSGIVRDGLKQHIKEARSARAGGADEFRVARA